MAGGYAHRPDGVEGLKALITDMQRQINDLRAAANSRSTGLVDANGNVVPLSEQITKGAQAVSIGLYSNTQTGTDADSGYVSDGAELTFHTYTGKFLLVNLASWATVLSTGSAGSMWLGYTASGAITRTADDSRSSFIMAQEISESGAIAAAPLVYAEVIEGPPGDVVVQQALRVANGDGGFAVGEVNNRAIIVFPF